MLRPTADASVGVDPSLEPTLSAMQSGSSVKEVSDGAQRLGLQRVRLLCVWNVQYCAEASRQVTSEDAMVKTELSQSGQARLGQALLIIRCSEGRII